MIPRVQPPSFSAMPEAARPTAQAQYQNGGWIRSMPWSKIFPKGEDCRVTRASLPSTVSRNVIAQAATIPSPNCPFQNSQKATPTSTALASVTWFGVSPRRAHQRVAGRASGGQTCLVTKSVTPL